MEKQFIVVGLLVVIGVVTILIGKVIGPRLLDWIGPWFSKATDRLDHAIVEPGPWETEVRELVEMKPEQLKQRVAEICSRFAKSAPAGVKPSTSWLPPSVRTFFENYSQLSFDGQTHILDGAVLRAVSDKKRGYLLIGRSEDDEHFYGIDLLDGTSVVLLQANEDGQVFSVEEDSPSFEHFVTLQHELHVKNS